MMTANQGRNFRRTTAAAGCVILLMAAAGALAEQTVLCPTGLRATIHTAEEITSSLLTGDKSAPVLVHPAVGSLELASGTGTLFPYDEAQVASALETMRGFVTTAEVEIFLLPAPPAAVGSSYASRNVIFLAPGTGAIPPMTQAYIATHELGHVLTWAFLDGDPARWSAYQDLRGLDPMLNGPEARHADRAREILAEDVRFLFGGPLATSTGTIENHDLATPDQVLGLEDLLAGYFAGRGSLPAGLPSTAFPNPCNPLTTVEMSLPSGASAGEASLDIYDLRGALVRTVTGGYQANGRVSLQWDGSTGTGAMAASGRYLYVIRLGSHSSRGAVTLVR